MSKVFDAIRKSGDHILASGLTTLAMPKNPRGGGNGFCLPGPELARVRSIDCHPSRPIELGREDPVGRERYRLLAQRLRSLRLGRPLARVLIASAVSEEGRTTVAINLALSLASGGGRVLLLDADLRKPAVHQALGVEVETGLTHVLTGSTTLADAVCHLSPLGLYCLAAPDISQQATELLQGQKFRRLIESTETAFDWVVVDSAPACAFADSAWLSGLTDATLIVTRSGRTPRAAFEEMLAGLEGSWIAGVVLNATQEDGYHRPRRSAGA